MVTQPFKDMKAEMEETTKRATMYALRATGRKAIEVAKSRAPVYPGSQNQSPYADSRAAAEAGTLRRSIHNAKNIKEDGGTYLLTVGPRGGVTRAKGAGARGVQLYAPKTEAMYGYMANAVNAGDLTAEYEEALAQGYGKFR